MRNRTSTTTEPLAVAAPICWQREASSACLRVELLNSEIHLFPYTHLVSAHLVCAAGDKETLHVTFSTHEVQVEGHNLRDLVLGIQDFAIKWLRAAPEKYRSVVSGDGVISGIRITASE